MISRAEENGRERHIHVEAEDDRPPREVIIGHFEAGDHLGAVALCSAELAIAPHDPGLWLLSAQIHQAAEQWGLAEVALRTAHAYGASAASLRRDLVEVLGRQGTSLIAYPLPKRNEVSGPQRSPGAPDISALAKLAWHIDEVSHRDMLELMRRCGSMDRALAAIIKDSKFAKANLPWLSVLRKGEF